MQEVDNDVVLSYSGSINLPTTALGTGLKSDPFVLPDRAALALGSKTGFTKIYNYFSQPDNYGLGTFRFASSTSGDYLILSDLNWSVSTEYASGESISGISTYSNASFATLAVEEGTYTWTWIADGGGTDFATLTIGSVPEPTTTTVLVSLTSLYFVIRKRNSTSSIF